MLRRQVLRFAITGGLATLTHIGVALGLNEHSGVSPLWANFMAFFVAWFVSYFGNYFWTFEKSSTHHWSLPRFGVTALAGFFASQFIVWLAVAVAGLSFREALVPVVLIVPAISFLMSRYWVFLSGTEPAIESRS